MNFLISCCVFSCCVFSCVSQRNLGFGDVEDYKPDYSVQYSSEVIDPVFDDHSARSRVTKIEVDGCNTKDEFCPWNLDSDVNVTMTFSSSVPADTLTLSLLLNYRLKEYSPIPSQDACKNLSPGGCPLKKHTTYDLSTSFNLGAHGYKNKGLTYINLYAAGGGFSYLVSVLFQAEMK